MAARATSGFFWLVACTCVGVLLWILGDIAMRGIGELSVSFLVDAPSNAGRDGGIGPILVSTLLIIAVALAVLLPLSLGTAVLLAEFPLGQGRFGRGVSSSLDALAAVASIVFGLFGNALFCHVLGLGYSILSGGLTLACMVIPVTIRSSEQTLRSVLIPRAAPGIAAGLVLGLGRALSETAALIFTAGYVTRMPESVFDSGRTMSVHIYDLSMNVPGGGSRAYATALVLILLLLIINATVLGLSRVWSRRSTHS